MISIGIIIGLRIKINLHIGFRRIFLRFSLQIQILVVVVLSDDPWGWGVVRLRLQGVWVVVHIEKGGVVDRL